MKLTWKNAKLKNKNRSLAAVSHIPDLPFVNQKENQINQQGETRKHLNEEDGADNNGLIAPKQEGTEETQASRELSNLSAAEQFLSQGNKLAEDGKYREALCKWEAAIALMPERAVLHEEKAQVLLEIGDAWNAVKAATRATYLEPSWAEAWITLGRAQLNFGEPDSAIESFDRAVAIKPNSVDAQDDKKTALHLIRKRKQLHLSGLSANKNRFVVGEKKENS